MSKIGHILLEKFHSNQLAQTYLLKSHDINDLNQWMKNWLREITPLQDHPDVLWVTRDEKDNEYKVETKGIKALQQFINYKPVQLKKRFIIVEDAHLISTIVANKLLKLLEEIPSSFTLFLLSPRSSTLLPTIESRSILLNIPLINEKVFEENNEFEQKSFHEILAILKNSAQQHESLKDFIENLINKKIKTKLSYADCEQILEGLKHFEESKAYNNALASRVGIVL